MNKLNKKIVRFTVGPLLFYLSLVMGVYVYRSNIHEMCDCSPFVMVLQAIGVLLVHILPFVLFFEALHILMGGELLRFKSWWKSDRF